jgi:hypothetical protein
MPSILSRKPDRISRGRVLSMGMAMSTRSDMLYDRFDQRALAERLVTDFASHVYFPAELELLFLSAGFEIARQYGDYRFVPFDRTSPYVVTVTRRPRRPRRSGRRPMCSVARKWSLDT